jgi:hypothetical protein
MHKLCLHKLHPMWLSNESSFPSVSFATRRLNKLLNQPIPCEFSLKADQDVKRTSGVRAALCRYLLALS